MALSNNTGAYYRTIRNTCLFANIAYIFLRLIYLVLFIVSKAYVLIAIDAVSILIYLFCFFLLKKKKYYIYALLCGNEFFVFVITTTIVGSTSIWLAYVLFHSSPHISQRIKILRVQSCG